MMEQLGVKGQKSKRITEVEKPEFIISMAGDCADLEPLASWGSRGP